VTVFDAGQENGQYFITMELLEGTPLDAIAKKRGALPPAVVAQLGIQIATGLHFAHRNKIIHRDIKTANLFLTTDKVVKIMDFGLAKMVEEVRKGATVIGGTPYYMAPEQGDGSEVDHRADLYSLGITLYQLATGHLPFSEGDVAYQHRHTPPPDPREFNAALPPDLAELILGLIQKRPDDRIQQAADVVRILQGMLDASSAGRTRA
jgi:serine/threonine-protein kinase